jgi:membrane-associated phospholipid phosphatase
MNDLIVFLAKYAILIPLAVNLYIFWKLDPKNRKKMLLLGVCGAILSFVLAKAAGHFYNNPRPPFKDGSKPLFTPSDRNGFPSDHTLLASWLALLL